MQELCCANTSLHFLLVTVFYTLKTKNQAPDLLGRGTKDDSMDSKPLGDIENLKAPSRSCPKTLQNKKKHKIVFAIISIKSKYVIK